MFGLRRSKQSRSPPAPDPKGFLDLCQRSGLLTAEQVQAAHGAVCSAASADDEANQPTDEALADYLIENKLLTVWQCNKLREGRWKGFFLGPYKILGHVRTDDVHAIYLAEDVISHRRDHLAVLPPSITGPQPVGYFEVGSAYFRIIAVNVGE